jgi:hypothetical protein
MLDRGAKRVVLSRGMAGRLQVSEEAVTIYNERRESEATGGLFHSTC